MRVPIFKCNEIFWVTRTTYRVTVENQSTGKSRSVKSYKVDPSCVWITTRYDKRYTRERIQTKRYREKERKTKNLKHEMTKEVIDCKDDLNKSP